MDIFRTLGRIKNWHFFIVAVLVAEIFTLVLNSVQSISRWGAISRELVEIGAIDAFFVSLIVTAMLLPLLRYTTKIALERKILKREIAEHKQMEETLMESEEKYRTLFNSAGDAIFIHNEEARMLAVNPMACERLGYPHAELMAMTVAQVDSPAEASHARQRMAQLMEHGHLSFETVHKRKDGSFIPTEVSARWITWDGQPAVMSICRDVTARRRAEAALRESERKYRELVENANSIILRWNPRGEITFLNEFGQKFFGYQENEILGHNVVGTIVPDSESTGRDLRPLMNSICENPAAFEQNVNENVLRDGRRVWIAWTNKKVFDVEGNLVEVLSIGTDITDSKRAEEVLIKNDRLLRRAEEVAKFGNWEFLLNENRVHASEGARAIYGLETKEWNISDVQSIPLPEYRRVLDQALVNLIERGIPYNVEFRICRPTDGKIIDINSIAEYDATKNVIFGVIQDITERSRVENEKDALQAQLIQAQKMESVGRLAGGVAHDFNNILSAILGYADLLHMKMPPDDPLRINIEVILESVKRAAQLTHSLLAFSRNQLMTIKAVDLVDLISGLGKMLVRIIGEDIEFRTEFRQKSLWIMADSGQIEQVIMNLATNARDAMPKGGSLTILIDLAEIDETDCEANGCEIAGKYVIITVSDTGIGISKEIQKRMFDPFFTTKDIGKGTGLGLSMVYGIVRQHKGFIAVDSDQLKGTSFRIYLPAIRPATEERTEQTVSQPVDKGTETILVAEDDPALRELSRIVLESFGYKVILAEDGQDAVTKFTTHNEGIGLVILDMMMPKMTGLESYEAIKNIRPKVKTLFISGYTADRVAETGLMAEGMEMIMKPISPRDLLRTVRRVLDSGAQS